jgi:hypothetical protein
MLPLSSRPSGHDDGGDSMTAFLPLVLWAAIGHGVETSPAPRASTVGELRPFDLTYMPRATNTVLAVRPAELLKRTDGLDKSATTLVRRSLAAGFAFLDGDIKAAEIPALTDVDQVVLSANVTIGIEAAKDGKSTFGLGGGISSGFIRTVKPFNWTAHIKKWFPKVEEAQYEGRTYLKIPIGIGDQSSCIALLAADDRTLAFDTDEDEMKNLLTRLKKKSPPVAPAGWDEVGRDLIAVSHDMTAEGWFTAPPKPKREFDKALVAAIHDLKGFSAGLSVGDTTTIRIIATARDEAAAKRALSAFKSLLAELASDKDVDPEKAKIVTAITVKRDGRILRATGAFPGNWLKLASPLPDGE